MFDQKICEQLALVNIQIKNIVFRKGKKADDKSCQIKTEENGRDGYESLRNQLIY